MSVKALFKAPPIYVTESSLCSMCFLCNQLYVEEIVFCEKQLLSYWGNVSVSTFKQILDLSHYGRCPRSRN